MCPPTIAPSVRKVGVSIYKKFEFGNLRKLMFVMEKTTEDCARAAHMSRSTLNNKLNGKTAFSMDEVIILSELLEIEPDEILTYFPMRKVTLNVK